MTGGSVLLLPVPVQNVCTVCPSLKDDDHCLDCQGLSPETAGGTGASATSGLGLKLPTVHYRSPHRQGCLHASRLKEAQLVILKKALANGGQSEKITELLLKHIQAEREKLLSSGLLGAQTSSVKTIHTQRGQYTVHFSSEPGQHRVCSNRHHNLALNTLTTYRHPTYSQHPATEHIHNIPPPNTLATSRH